MIDLSPYHFYIYHLICLEIFITCYNHNSCSLFLVYESNVLYLTKNFLTKAHAVPLLLEDHSWMIMVDSSQAQPFDYAYFIRGITLLLLLRLLYTFHPTNRSQRVIAFAISFATIPD